MVLFNIEGLKHNMKTQTEKYVEISYEDLNIKENYLDDLSKVGLNMIQNNRKDLINYAINKMMEAINFESEEDTTPNDKIKKLSEKIKLVIERE